MNAHLMIVQQDKVNNAEERGPGRVLTVFFCNKACRVAWKHEPVTNTVRPLFSASSTEWRLNNYYLERTQMKSLAKTLTNVIARTVQSRSYWRAWSNSILRTSSYCLPQESQILDHFDKQMIECLDSLMNVIERELNQQELAPETVTPHDKNAECDHCSLFSDC